MIVVTAILSLVGLLVLHELSHFLVAKMFGMRVEEFGIGYPPRLFGKKMGDTIYSLNLIPFGAFVNIPQEEMRGGTFWQRFAVLMAGVVSFWIFSFLIFSVVFMMGSPIQVGDDIGTEEALVQIVDVADGSPAQEAGIKTGDIILSLDGERVTKVSQVQDLINSSEVSILLKRGEESILLDITPRQDPPEGEGALGVALIRMTVKRWGVWEALRMGCQETVDLTVFMIKEGGRAIGSIFTDQKSSVSLMGPVGIMGVFVEMGNLGTVYFLRTMGVISLNLAIINAFPLLPVADGGRVSLLILEKIRKKPLSKGVEEGISKFFFAFLILVMILVTFKDITSLLK